MTTLAGLRACVTCGAAFPARKRECGRPEQRHCSRSCWLERHNTPERNREAARKGAAKNRATQLEHASHHARQRQQQPKGVI